MKSTEIRSQIVTLWFNIFGPTREPDPYSIMNMGIFHISMLFSQVSIHVAATHQTSQHQTLKSQIQMVGPYARLA